MSKISNATPKVGDYPFTTLHPVLGVIRKFDKEIILADIPGLIEGAHEGKGLGDQFLAHIERCKILLHVIDSNEKDIINNYNVINNELIKYGKNLNIKKQLIALSKTDLLSKDLNKKSKSIEKQTGIKPIHFSSFSSKDLKKLIGKLFKECEKIND